VWAIYSKNNVNNLIHRVIPLVNNKINFAGFYKNIEVFDKS